MPTLIEKLQARVADWRSHHFRDDVYPAIAEILHWAAAPEGAGFTLRAPQLRALEVYWFLRLVEGTPKVIGLYQKDFPSDDPGSLLEALGIPDSAWKESKYALSQLWNNIESNDDFIRRHNLQALRETLALEYPSYIIALAMGAGKTALIGAIVATEFAMALEYADGPFVQNALVFAPGTTILGALRELATVPYERILPRVFSANSPRR